MRNFEQWMSEYGESHQNKTNQTIHKICVPLIMFSVLGILWSIPAPINLAITFTIASLIFYFSLNFKYACGMFVQSIAMLAFIQYLAKFTPIHLISIFIFVLSWIAQFYGHKIEGKKPSFLKDLAFLLIGPLWVLHSIYKKVDI
jgi:uncharacterized membrane protein YGL010W